MCTGISESGEFMKNINTTRKLMSIISAAVVCASMATGCSNNSSGKNSKAQSESVSSADKNTSGKVSVLSDMTSDGDYDALFSSRDLNNEYNDITAYITLDGSTVSIEGSGASSEGTTITIYQEGVYHISGTLSDGQIIINAEKAKVQLVLDNADITSSTSSAIYGLDSDKIFITTAPGSSNTLTDAEAYADDADDAPDACIFSNDSLTLNGTGKLTVNGRYSDGIHSKDDIVITSGSITVDAANDGINGKDYVAIADGDINITAGRDGIRSTNATDEGAGFVYVKDGNITVDAGGDAIQAETELVTAGGEFGLRAGGGSENSTKTHSDDFGGFGGFGGNKPDMDFDPSQFGDFDPSQSGDFVPSQFGEKPDQRSQATPNMTSAGLSLTQLINTSDSSDDTSDSSDDSDSTKGLKAGTAINITGGTFSIDSADDALHSNGNVSISGGTLDLSAGDDGIHADSDISISGGNVTISKSYEGIEGAVISVSGGVTEVTSEDDGFNASDGTPQGGMGTYSDSVKLEISGGTVYVNASGDGLDSNGDLTISGGNIIVNGPVNSANGALDSNSGIVVTGGTIIASGSSGMAEAPDSSSTQNSVSATFDSTVSAGTLVTLTDDSGNEIVSFTSVKDFNNVVISSADLNTGSSYTFYTGGSTSGSADKYGIYSTGYKGDGTESGSFTANDKISYIGKQSMMGGGFGGRGGGMGSPDGDFQIPTDENGDMIKPDGDFGGMTPPSGGKKQRQHQDNDTARQ